MMSPIDETRRQERLQFRLGLVVSIFSLLVMLLAVGNLISIQHTPDQLITAFRERLEGQMKEMGLRADVVSRFSSGVDISPDTIATLPREQQQLIAMAQELLPAMAVAVKQAAEKSRKKSLWGIGIALVILLSGVGLMSRGTRPAKQPLASEANGTHEGSDGTNRA